MTITILKSLIIIIILVVMVVMLLSIDHIFSGSFNAGKEDGDRMRKDVNESEEVLTDDNVFGGFTRR